MKNSKQIVPKTLTRLSDNEIFVLNEDGRTYSNQRLIYLKKEGETVEKWSIECFSPRYFRFED